MISKRTDAGISIYYAIEEFTGSIEGRDGGLTLVHQGFMSQSESSLDIKILEGSGQGQLISISGKMKITRDNGTHQYVLEYKLN